MVDTGGMDISGLTLQKIIMVPLTTVVIRVLKQKVRVGQAENFLCQMASNGKEIGVIFQKDIL